MFFNLRSLELLVFTVFVKEGMGRLSPWKDLRGQIFLGGESFLAQMELLAETEPLDNRSKLRVRQT